MRFTEHSLFQWFTEARFGLEMRFPWKKIRLEVVFTENAQRICARRVTTDSTAGLYRGCFGYRLPSYHHEKRFRERLPLCRQAYRGPHCKHKNFLLPFKESLIQMLSFIFFFLWVSLNGIQIIQFWFFSEMVEWLKYAFCLISHSPSLHFSVPVRHKQRATRIDIWVRATGGFPGWICLQCTRCKRCRFNPWVGKMPWRRTRQPTSVFLPGEPHEQRSLVRYIPWVHK